MAVDWALDHTVNDPLPPELEALEARVRIKLEMKERLTPEERAFFALEPGEKGVRPDAVGKTRPTGAGVGRQTGD